MAGSAPVTPAGKNPMRQRFKGFDRHEEIDCGARAFCAETKEESALYVYVCTSGEETRRLYRALCEIAGQVIIRAL